MFVIVTKAHWLVLCRAGSSLYETKLSIVQTEVTVYVLSVACESPLYRMHLTPDVVNLKPSPKVSAVDFDCERINANTFWHGTTIASVMPGVLYDTSNVYVGEVSIWSNPAGTMLFGS